MTPQRQLKEVGAKSNVFRSSSLRSATGTPPPPQNPLSAALAFERRQIVRNDGGRRFLEVVKQALDR